MIVLANVLADGVQFGQSDLEKGVGSEYRDVSYLEVWSCLPIILDVGTRTGGDRKVRCLTKNFQRWSCSSD